MKDDKKKNTTKYGEYIPSYFSWQSLENQKERAKELDNMTKNKNKNN